MRVKSTSRYIRYRYQRISGEGSEINIYISLHQFVRQPKVRGKTSTVS